MRETTMTDELMGAILPKVFDQTEMALSNKSVRGTIFKIKVKYQDNHRVAS